MQGRILKFLWAFISLEALFLRGNAMHESIKDAAVIARTLVDMSTHSVATMATVFPENHPSLAGFPFSLQEYYASCFQNGSLSLLFLPISQHSRNILASESHVVSISIMSAVPAAQSPRVALLGNITIFQNSNEMSSLPEVKACYLSTHPDAKRWLPDDDEGAHISYWARFDPQSVYFVGGFGGRHYIGFIPVSLYQAAEPQSSVLAVQSPG